MADISENEDRIAASNQNFNKGIALILVEILLSYSYYFLHGYKYKTILVSILMIIAVFILQEFKRYLQRFNDNAVLQPVSRLILTNLIIAVLFLLLLITRSTFRVATYKIITAFHVLLLLGVMTLIFINLTATIMLGRKLIKIENDVIGLLHWLGKLYIYLIPALFFFVAILLVNKNIRHYYLSPGHVWMRIIVNTLCNIPNVLLTIIFYQAAKVKH